MFKQSMVALSALAVLVALSGVSKADDDNNAANDGYRQLTCADATQAAWFAREMERSDGDTPHDVAVPAECNRELVAAAAASAEESK